MEVRLLDLAPHYDSLRFATPLKIGSGSIEAATCLTVTATVETPDGRLGEGRGAILLSHVWSWPSPESPGAKDAAMRRSAERRMAALLAAGGARTPLEWYAVATPDPDLPPLAAAVAASPIDSAIHDALGHAVGSSSYDLLPDRIRRWLTVPATRVPVMHTVGLSDAEAGLRGAIKTEGIFGFKVKLAGDPARDAARTEQVYRLAARNGARMPILSADGNESYRVPEAVTEYLRQLPEDVLAALSFVEQPTPRKSEANMSGPAAIKPILADEGWATVSDLQRLLELGWSGAVLKTCKGHSAALLALAMLAEEGRPYAVQDLTNPGIALIHSLGLAARCTPLAGLEANARQYLPDHHPVAFPVANGELSTAALARTGLGYPQ